MFELGERADGSIGRVQCVNVQNLKFGVGRHPRHRGVLSSRTQHEDFQFLQRTERAEIEWILKGTEVLSADVQHLEIRRGDDDGEGDSPFGVGDG